MSSSNTTTLPSRPLGRTGYSINPIGLGAWAIGAFMWGPQDDADSVAALNAALDSDVDFIDTAIAYGMGHSERLVGQVLRERGLAGKVVVASKIPPMTFEWTPDPGTPMRDVFPADYITKSIDQSLENTGLERIDVMQLHTWCPTWNDETEWYEAMLTAKRAGKIGAIGISVSDHRCDEANGTVAAGRVEVVQAVYNVLDQRPAEHLFPLAQQHGVGVIARVPLASGALTGKWTYETTFAEDDWRSLQIVGDRLHRVVDDVRQLAFLTEDGGTLGQAALRFAVTHPAVSVCIPGARDARQAHDNAAAGAMGVLSAEQVARVDALWREQFSHDVQTGDQTRR